MIADNLDALARALREWSAEAWRKVASTDPNSSTQATACGLFERLVARTAPAALDVRQRARALKSAEAVADVLRVLWPEVTNAGGSHDGRLVATT